MPPRAVAAASKAALSAALPHYAAALEARQTADKTAKSLVRLDKWYRQDLRSALQARGSDAHVTKAELEELMRWKLARGSWRPKLQDLVASNQAAAVESTSRSAFAQLAATPARALTTLCALSGVGPATASALLAAHSPATEPFMSDEGMVGACGLEKKYTEKAAREYRAAMLARVESEGWTDVEELERAAWALLAGAKFRQADVLAIEKKGGKPDKSNKRGADDDSGEGSSSAKKPKTAAAKAPSSKAAPAKSTRSTRSSSRTSTRIHGIGIDLLSLDRIAMFCTRGKGDRTDRLARRILSPEELDEWRALDLQGERAQRWLGVRWAAKEAAYKALSPIKLTSWSDVSVLQPGGTGKPSLALSNAVRERSPEPLNVHLSVSHDGGMVAAYVIVESSLTS